MITTYLTQRESLKELQSALASGPQRVYAPSVFQGYLLAALREAAWSQRKLLVVAPDASEASRLANDIRAFSGDTPVWILPPRGTIRGSGLIPSHMATGRRHRAVNALAGEAPCIVVTDAVALLERDLDPASWAEPVRISPAGGHGADTDRPQAVGAPSRPDFEQLVRMLSELGYERVDQVEDRGQFAVRGGIIDCFPSTDATPLRFEFWGEELESLRRFSPFTQRSLGDEPQASIYMAATADEEGAASRSGTTGGASPGLLKALEKISPREEPVLTAVDRKLFTEALESFREDAAGVAGERGFSAAYLTALELEQQLDAKASVTIESLAADQPHGFPASGFRFASRKQREAAERLDRLVSDGYRVFVHFSSEGAARRAEHVFTGHASLLEAGAGAAPQEPGAWLVVAPAPAGFVSNDLKIAVFGERSLLRPERAARRQDELLGGRGIAGFRELSPGDFVVHRDHGIGVFEAVETRTVAGVTRDYLHLRYKGDDALFVPQEQIDKVARYIGTQESAPPLNKLGGRAWALARSRARTAAREMAGELLQLYAARQSLPGHAFELDGEWQLQLEADFPYRETRDQAAAIEDVKDDMESAHPMDRLICGDVGFGKTEVAIRAAFKAATQNSQVLMLVPTTILAMQHYETFRKRFEPFPVKVEMISRFRTQAEARRIADDFREGRIDVLIGTHRLLSSDIIPRELGLVIVDEEQRFGVAQKEHLRQLRLKVDVLSLTATPIPRTLQMSLSGVRDISIIETPPAGRNPIRTFVGEYDDEMVGRAITSEKERGGQVFFLHNRVETIDEQADQLRRLLPGVRFLVAHGQMPEKELESVMVSFLEGEADVLVCTSIIESGLDIPTANTLIVDRADTLGLAQLYQIRGRIGRSDRDAHAYLFYPPFTTPTRDAMARLSTLSDYTDLGSGFRIAMRDLELRGAGNLLGGEQSGHVAAVGFDMYLDLLRRAVSEFRNEPLEEKILPRLEVDIDAYIPGSYIPFEAARIEVHHHIAGAADREALERVEDELRDRFGPVPEVVGNLLRMQDIRIRAGSLGASAVTLHRGRLEISGIVIDAAQRQRLEQTGLDFVYHPLKRVLVVWTRDEDGLVALSRLMDAIINGIVSSKEKQSN